MDREKMKNLEDEKRLRQLEEQARGLARRLDVGLQESTGRRVGFILMLFEFGEGGPFTYIANGQRADAIKVVEEWLAREKAR